MRDELREFTLVNIKQCPFKWILIREEEMVFYLKINRNERYTFRNLQHWIHIIECIPDSRGYILCDDKDLQQAVLEQVAFRKDTVTFMESCRASEEVDYIVSNVTSGRWQNAGYAHISTFWHARENQYPCFWNIDADDTCICLAPLRVYEALTKIEKYAKNDKVDAFSLDMWVTRTKGYHWSFGITYINNTIDWFGVMKEHCQDEIFKAGQIKNVDGYFSCLKMRTNLKIETFYLENLKFVHYSDDFLKRPDASGFFHWKEGKLHLPILKYCMGMEDIGLLNIPKGLIEFDIGITDEEMTGFLLDYVLPEEKNRLMVRMAAELEQREKERQGLK